MKHLIMGTAGHIDHGKTTLIRALTNIECDTHKEEKKRGITINLGFAHMNFPSGESVGIVDVPGHKDFVHTMVGGARGIDFVLLVVAADSGVMPQTREHLQIMNILNVKQGIMVLTKTDLIEDKGLLEITKTEIQELVKDTFLEKSPIVEVSVKTGSGLEKLKEKIKDIIALCEEKSTKGFFRMFIDRIFSATGFGTVVTGSVLSGSLKIKDHAYLLPGKEKKLIVRHLERHGEKVPEVIAGDRASINLVGLSREDFERGMILSNEMLNATTMLDAKLELFKNSTNMGIWTQVIFHVGTYEKQARIHLINKNKLVAGENAMVQIHLRKPCVLSYGDRFVIRNSSSDTTLGGGVVIDVNPLRHRKRPEKLIKKMTSIARGKLDELIVSETKKFHRAATAREIAFNLNITSQEVEMCISNKLPKDIVKYDGKEGMIFITKDLKEKLRHGILNAVKEFRKQNPYLDRGTMLSEIRGSLKIESGSPSEEILKKLLELEKQKRNLQEKDKTWMLAGDLEEKNRMIGSHLKFFSEYLNNFKMQVPLQSQIRTEAAKRDLSEKDLKQILRKLTSTREIYRIKDDYIHSSIVDGCRDKLITELGIREKGITVAEFRDLIGGNRKICLLLLAQYDSEMLTKRIGDIRILVKKRD